MSCRCSSAIRPFPSRSSPLSIKIVTDVATVNLNRHEADLALRMVKPVRGNVTLRRVGSLGFSLYGSAAYMVARREGARVSMPHEKGLFDHDRFIGWSERQGDLPAAKWLERVCRGRPPVLATTTLSAQVSAARAGLGLAVLPYFLALEASPERMPVELGLDQPISAGRH